MRSGSVHRHADNTPPMLVPRLLTAGLLLGFIGFPGFPVVAADAPQHGLCLTKAEQRAAVDSSRAISLAQALKVLRQYRRHSEVVRARLCRQDEKLVYVLTLLGRSGKVVDATVDAVSSEYHAP